MLTGGFMKFLVLMMIAMRKEINEDIKLNNSIFL